MLKPQSRPIWGTRRLPGWLGLVPAVAFLAVVFAIPLVRFLFNSFVDGSGYSLHHYVRMFQTPVYVQVIATTFKIALYTTGLSLIAGYPLAYFIARLPENSRSRWMVWILLPFWTSFLVRTFAWIVLLGRQGPVSQLFLALGAEFPPELLYNMTGVMIGMVQALMPFALLTMISVMENVDRDLEAAAATLGAPPSQSFLRVFFPLSLPGVMGGGVLVFITALGFFITPALLGGRREIVITAVIFDNINQFLNWGFGGALSVVLLVATVVVLLGTERILGAGFLYGSLTGRGGSAMARAPGEASRSRTFRHVSSFVATVRDKFLEVTLWAALAWERLVANVRSPSVSRPPRRWGRYVLAVVAVAVIVYLVAPAFLLVPVSFTGSNFLEFPPPSYSMRWYQTVLKDRAWIDSLLASLEVAALAAVGSALLGFPAAWALVRKEFPGKNLLTSFLMAPMMIPRMVSAVAMFYVFTQLRLAGTFLGLVLAHIVITLPYFLVSTTAVLKSYDERLDQAAATLGASPVRVLWHVTLPNIRTGIISGMLFAFVTSFDDLTLSLFLTAGKVVTLPRKMWNETILQVNPSLAVVSTILVVCLTGILFTVDHLGRRRPA